MITTEILHKYFVEASFKKNEFLTMEGAIEQFLYYIKSGVVRWFSYDNQGNEHSFDFAFSGDFANSYQSFKEQKPSVVCVQAMTKIECYKIHRNSLHKIMREDIELTYLFIEIIERLFIRKTKRELALIKNTPQENYEYLLQKEPYLLRNIPLQYIASYIGITPQALSRIRKRIS